MIRKNPINCPSCGTEVVSDERNLMMFCLTEDIKCPSCGTVVVYANRPEMKV